MNTFNTSGPMRAGRREFLRRGSPFALNLLAMGAASAQTGGGHKALVCVFLSGGNDQSNTVVPTSSAGWAAYSQARPTLAIPAAQLLSINPTDYNGEPLGLHGSLSALKPLFDQQRVALLATHHQSAMEPGQCDRAHTGAAVFAL